MSLPAAPPSYAEATAGDKEHRAGNLNYASQPPPMPPPSMPMHPSWAYVHPGPSKSHCFSLDIDAKGSSSCFIASLVLFIFSLVKLIMHNLTLCFPQGPGYSHAYAADMSSPFSDPSSSSSFDGLNGSNWEDKNVRRMFIRKVRMC